MALGLIALWALSPLGGQASTRILEFEQANRTFSNAAVHLDVNNTFDWYAGADDASELANAAAVFISALSSSLTVKTSG